MYDNCIEMAPSSTNLYVSLTQLYGLVLKRGVSTDFGLNHHFMLFYVLTLRYLNMRVHQS